jgi:phosphatidylserine/phosphatidylglycerophosphate/cardiolipin synthase-like enzyme
MEHGLSLVKYEHPQPERPLMPAPSLSKVAGVQAVFDGHERRICQLAKSSHAVVGCVAWVTNQRILHSLSLCPCGVSVVVHDDEHFALTDRIGLRTNAVPPMAVDCEGPDVSCIHPYVPMADYSAGGSDGMLHAKFLVFCEADGTTLVPRVTWIGSANLTNKATRNVEASLVVVDEVTAKAFASAWRNCLSFAVQRMPGRFARSAVV